jgi:hypothetical protein
MLRRSAKTRLPLQEAVLRYWPYLLGITAFHFLVVFVPGVSTNWPLVQALFFLAVLPAMYPVTFGSAKYSFWVLAMLYWFFGYILTFVLKALIFMVVGWQL